MDTCPAPGSDQILRRRSSCKQMSEILGIKHHHPPHHFQLSKEWKKGRSATPGSLPTYHGIPRRPHHQHYKPDQATTLLQQSLPDPKTDQRNGILLNLHQSTPTSHTTVISAPSVRSLVTMFKVVPRSVKLLMISTTEFNRPCITSLTADECPMDGKMEIKTFSLPNGSTKDPE